MLLILLLVLCAVRLGQFLRLRILRAAFLCWHTAWLWLVIARYSSITTPTDDISGLLNDSSSLSSLHRLLLWSADQRGLLLAIIMQSAYNCCCRRRGCGGYLMINVSFRNLRNCGEILFQGLLL